MKTYLFSVLILTFLVSCKQQTDLKEQPIQPSETLNPLTNPDHFIGNHKAKAMVLGVFHFNNPGLDSYKPRFPFNILEDKRQRELNELLDKIAAYKPTKILLEVNRIKGDSIINKRYLNYLSGEYTIDNRKSETYQIGFKLAEKLEHKKVYASDASANWFGVELDWDNYDGEAYLKSKGQFEKCVRYDYESFYELKDSLKTVQTLIEHLATINNPKDRLKDHQAYLTCILEGAGDNYLGADNVGRWYRRNLRIFANAYDFTNFNKEERLLLIYGSGHVWQLRQLFKDSPDYDYIEPNTFLIESN